MRWLSSLKSVLLAQELAFLFLVAVTGALGGTWAYFWQKNSAELVRLNELTYLSQQIRGDLFRQIKEVLYARMVENPEAFELYGSYSRLMDRHFIDLRQQADRQDERQAIDGLQQAYRVLQSDMNHIFSDPYLPTQTVRIKVLDPRYEEELVGGFEAALSKFASVIHGEHQVIDQTLQRWTQIAPIVLPLPILLALTLIVMARRWLQRGFVGPMAAVMAGAQRISRDELQQPIPEQGVDEMVDLARTVNHMAGELLRSRDALVESEKNSALGALVPVVAHNIRNPLASIRASAQLLDHADQPGEIAEIKHAIVDTVDRLGRWVSALVSYLHPLKPAPARRHPTQLLEAALTLLQPRLTEKKILIERGAWDTGAMVIVDADLMEQAFYGLLSNAVDASPVAGTLTLAAAMRGADYEIIIADQGAGMPFLPEPRGLKPGPSTKRFGTGLGIPVAFKVCKAHGWQLEFQRNEPTGTRVVITAPLAPVH
ncbi:MAG TPA: HAMP domain-containing sensor histidine kinase [Gammaproteobacteria bacterium]|nr:HAMP domain-containing sensor histidine kinase [Gammaproteobacteria bacterium]